MKKAIIGGLLAATTIAASSGLASANTTLYEQDFNDGSTGDWVEYSAAVANDGGTLRVSAPQGSKHGAYSYFGGIASSTGGERTTHMGDGYIAELGVYIDQNMAEGNGFDLSVASSTATGEHQQDHIFHVGKVGSDVIVNASNNADFVTNEYKLLNENGGNYGVLSTGWYTLQHVVGSSGGFGQVTFNVIDSDGDVAWSAVRAINDNGAAVAESDVYGARYQWLTHVDGSFQFDNQSLERVVAVPGTKDDCKKGGYADFGFDNQGQCIASVVANPGSRS